ncbi:hypothetical protein LTR53_010040 [Teratosphaeriaceae sp. CCFEE 6253]|nr:hypothetical protein LTR53_010040 [Teratosphaeriaceae sp. CCFEE 6253]
MPWLAPLVFAPALPVHCEPTNDFLLRFSSAFHVCVPTPLAFTSSTLGTLSIVAWLCAQLPQIYKNWRIASTSGLSIFFLVEWCLGDVGNLFGALFTHQASWQVTIGGYYVFVDLCLLAQWVWYEKLRHGAIVRRAWARPGYRDDDAPGGSMEEVIIEGMPVSPAVVGHGGPDGVPRGQDKLPQPTRPKVIFRNPTFQGERRASGEKQSSSLAATTPGGTTIYRVGPSSPLPSPSPRTVLLLACFIAIAQASPLVRPPPLHSATVPDDPQPTPLEHIGSIMAWLSTFLYLGSRLPQLWKNWSRKSTAGLSPHLFAAAFCGNTFYSAALLTNPCGWSDFAPHGGGGWVGPAGSERGAWTLAALPFFLGAAGVLGLDASVGVQFLLYGDGAKVLVVEGDRWHRKHWRRFNGWMRGWIPSISESKGVEREALVARDGQLGEGYGTVGA